MNAFKALIVKKSQWTDYNEDILELVTVNADGTNAIGRTNRVLNPSTFPFSTSHIHLPQDNSGYVYMLVSMKHNNYVYIGTTKDIRSRINMHNSGNGAIEIAPAYLRPFALLSFVCGFGGTRRDLRYYIERKWKERRDELIGQGINDFREWALCVKDVINRISGEDRQYQFGVSRTDLTVVQLFES